jgi:hypothetical protein
VLIRVGRQLPPDGAPAVLEDPAAGRAADDLRRPALGLIFALINIVGVEFLINFGGLGPAHQRARRALRPAGHLRRDPVRRAGEHPLLRAGGALERWLRPSPDAARRPGARRGTVAARGHRRACCVAWQALACRACCFAMSCPRWRRSDGAIVRLLSDADFYANLCVDVVGDRRRAADRRSRRRARGPGARRQPFLSRAYEPFVYYLGPDAEDHLLPDHDHVVRRRPGSKVAMGALSCFFPIAISVAAGMRQIEPVLVRVGRASALRLADDDQDLSAAMREPIINGVRLGLGIAIIGTLLAETKLSNSGSAT